MRAIAMWLVNNVPMGRLAPAVFGYAIGAKGEKITPSVEEIDMKYYTSEDAGSGQHGICEKCKKGPTKEGHDGCLGTLPGPIMNACCGHGNNRQAYIQYWGEDGNGGKRISGDEAIAEQARLARCRGERYEPKRE